MEAARPIQLLYVDDDQTFFETLRTFLNDYDSRLVTEVAASPETALEQLESTDFDCIVADIDMQGPNGIEFLKAVRSEHPELPFILFTDNGSGAVASEAISAGVTDYLQKESGAERLKLLVNRISTAVGEYRARRRADLMYARFQALTENTKHVVITIDDSSTIRYVNDAVTAIFGYAPADLEGESLLQLMPARFHESHEKAIERYLSTGTKQLEWDWVELPGEHADGHEIQLGISFGEATVDGEHRFTAVIRDITAQKRLEQERVDTIEALGEMYELMADPDETFEGKIDRLLRVGCEKFGLPYGFLSRLEFDDDGNETGTQRIVRANGNHELLQPGESCPLSQAYCRKTIEEEELLAIQDAVAAGWENDPAYETFQLGCYIGAKVYVDDELYGTFCFAASDACERPFSKIDRMLIRLMSKWASYELERKLSRAELKEQNERLEEFASVVSHDLRNPLQVAEMNLNLVADECQTEYVDPIENALDRMHRIIDDVLWLAREGQSIGTTEPVHLRNVATNAWAVTGTDRTEATLETESGLPKVEADEDRLQQLLENLYRNAIEHSDPPVTVTVGRLADGFYVEDDGPGIPEDLRTDIFEAGMTTADDGTGYGLHIVKQIVDAHGWDITVTKSNAGGARFEITVPAG